MKLSKVQSKTANKSIQRTVKSAVSLRYTLLLTAADAWRYLERQKRVVPGISSHPLTGAT